MKSAEVVIARFGGQSALARLVGRRQSTVQYWAKSGHIPAKWQPQLLKLATERGIDLSLADVIDGSAHSHVVQFYDNDSFLIENCAHFVGSALESGNAAVVVATKSHRRQLAERLSRRGFDLAAATSAGRYIALDAAVTLSKFMIDGSLDEARFRATMKQVIERANCAAICKYPRAAWYGEMVALLCRDGKRESAIQLEQLANDLQQSCDCSVLCGYPMDGFSRQENGQAFVEVCALHSDVIPAENYSVLANESERRRAIARLQQRIRALETEMRLAEEQLGVFQTVPGMGSFEIDLSHDSISFSRRAQEMLGVGTPRVALPEFLQAMYTSRDQEAFMAAIKPARNKRKEASVTFRIKGRQRPRMLRSYSKTLYNGGQPIILGLFQMATLSEASKSGFPPHWSSA